MILTRLELSHYRNFDTLDFAPSGGLTVLAGENAQGKTNLVEAIYLCCTARSHRTPRDRELIHWGDQEAWVRSSIRQADGTHQVELMLRENGRKSLKVNGLPSRRLGELMGHMNAVIFSPEDLSLIKDGPAARRRFMDMEISQTDALYFYDLQNYQQVLKQRHALLKSLASGKDAHDQLPVWDAQLAAHGARICLKRREFSQLLSVSAADIHARISDGESLSLRYLCAVESETEEDAREELMLHLEKNRASDIRTAITSCGPHRDDLQLSVDGYELRAYGSQGQHRTAALSLKLSELDIMKHKSGESPILILDDVLSELDESRRRSLLSAMSDIQTFVTCVQAQSELDSLTLPRQMYHVSDGTLKLIH